jgi:penicillin-binding protein 1C
VSLYAAIGAWRHPVTLNDGVRPAVAETGTAPVLDPVAAWYVSNILADVPPPLNGSPGRIAYKTGTSYGYRDAWAIGYDGKTVIGVWVGRPDGASVPGISGIKAAAPILFESFDRLGMPKTPLPARRRGRAGGVDQFAELPLPLQALPPPRR